LIGASLILSSSTSMNAFDKISDSVASPSNGKRTSLPWASRSCTMQKALLVRLRLDVRRPKIDPIRPDLALDHQMAIFEAAARRDRQAWQNVFQHGVARVAGLAELAEGGAGPVVAECMLAAVGPVGSLAMLATAPLRSMIRVRVGRTTNGLFISATRRPQRLTSI
jgi:hypothetical protein